MECDWLKKWSTYSPSAIALKDVESGRNYSYQECFNRANAIANHLQDRYGVKAGDRVAVLASNEIETVFLFFACLRLGAILVPVNFRLTSPEIDYIIGDCSPRLLIYQKMYGEVVSNLKCAPSLLLNFAELKNYVTGPAIAMRADFSTATMILYTSGTTGFPKGAVLTHGTLFWNSVNTSLRLNLSQNDVTHAFLPLYHTGGWNVLLTPFIHRGAKLLFMKKFEPETVLRLVEEEKTTILFGVPTTMDMMARSPGFKNTNLSSLRYAIVGGEPMPLELIEKWQARGVAIRQGYGLTEFGPNVFSLNEEDAIRKKGSIGFPNFYVEVKVVDEEGESLGSGEIGELVLRGPMCMQGYWNKPEATAQTIRDGWLHTGDLVRFDDEGYFYVVGRKKDMFISGGENVYPTEIEQTLRSHEWIKEAAVIGVPDEKWGEVGKAFVVLEPGRELSPADILKFCHDRLAKYKTPRHFEFLAELPKGDSGKVLKKSLKVPGSFSLNS